MSFGDLLFFHSLVSHILDPYPIPQQYHHIDINFGPDPEGDRKIIDSEIPDDPATWRWTEADKLFLKLIDEVHKRGMKIIIDGVFNHTGTQFWAFKDVEKNGDKSRYKDWYIIKSFDDPATDTNEFDYICSGC